jgi:hypothetical protein
MFLGRFTDPESDLFREDRWWGILGPGEEDLADPVASGVVHAVPEKEGQVAGLNDWGEPS